MNERKNKHDYLRSYAIIMINNMMNEYTFNIYIITNTRLFD